MTRYILAAFALCILNLTSVAQEPYAVSRIPEALLKNANVVTREETIRFEVFNTRKAVNTHRYVYTILNENGDKYASLYEFYDKFREISSISGSLYDASGKLIKKLKSKDVQDLSAVDNISIMDDNRKKEHNFYHKVYPYTVEYEIETIFHTTYTFPSWYTQYFENQSVQNSNLEVITPADYVLRYRMYNYKGEPAVVTDNNKKKYSWSASNLNAIQKESYAPEWHEITTAVVLAPSSFEMEGYKGDMSSWQEYGKFMYQLCLNRDALPPAIKEKVKELTAGITDDRKKIEALFTYMQQNTRYISIQLGIGGLQPFEATYVAQKGFGDCKALSNYMYSLLKEAGIRSNHTIIRGGRGEYFVPEDFPSDPFNHVVLCVPLKTDTVWLECTSQTNAAGYMGGFTGNRKALLIDENGGTLVSTPRYNASTNTQVRKTFGKVADDGSLNINVETTLRGMQQDSYHSLIHNYSKDKIKEVLQSSFELSTYNINNFSYKEIKQSIPEIIENLDITVSGYATITGKRLFITPNVLNRNRTSLNADDERKFDIRLEDGFTDIDTVEIELPSGFEVEALPEPVNISNKFGSYYAASTVKNNKIVYVRKRVYNVGKFPASEYKDLAGYFQQISKADRNRIVLVKKESAVAAEKKTF
jgi:hypothetical protein